MAEQSLARRISESQLEFLLKPILGSNLIVEEFQCKSNTKPGENYGSVMLALDITFRPTKNSASEVLNVVAKFAPPTEFLQEIFDFKNTFCKEMNMYKLVGPIIRKLQQESDIPEADYFNVLAKYYGAQTSSAGDQDCVADIDAVLLLENLKISGYKMADRLAGLDLQHCKLVMSKLAQFHALPIALRQKQPGKFEETIMKTTREFKMGGEASPLQKDLENLLEALQQKIPECSPYITRIRKHCLQNIRDQNKSFNKKPFATIVHNDFWTNNMMFYYEDSTPIDIKFVDFQITLMCSPVRDIIFFLFTSSRDEVLRDHFDHLISLYYTNFIKTLERVKCDTSAFSFENFLSEINEFAPREFYHVLFMLNVVYTEKSDIVELSEIDGNESIKFISGSTCKQKMLTHIQEFERRGWLTNAE